MGRVMGIRLAGQAEAPLYQQLIDVLAGRIKSGALPPGFRLPPTRALAQELEVHRNTVVRAFEELSSLGFLTATVGRGTFVSEASLWGGDRMKRIVQMPVGVEERQPLPWDALVSQAVNAEPLVRRNRLERSVLGSGGAINLARMEPPRQFLPIENFRRCMDHVLRTRGGRAMGYAPRQGLLVLRESIAAELGARGIPVREEDIVITSGSQQGLDLLARSLLNPGDTILSQSSTYVGALTVFSTSGARVVGVPGDDHGPRMSSLERLGQSRAKALYLMPNVCNPTGVCISQKRREALIDWSHTYGVPLIEDDYAADLELDETEPPVALRALDPEVIYVSSFSKKLLPALRLGYLVCPEALQARILPLKKVMDMGTSALMQYALAEFLDRGYMRAHLKKLLPAMRERRDALEASLRRHLPSEIGWRHVERGALLWLELPPSLSPEIVFDEARRAGVLVTPGGLYEATGGNAHSGLRLVFYNETPARLTEAGKRLGKVLTRLLAQAVGSNDQAGLVFDGA